MTSFFLDKIDAAPLESENFDYPFNTWVANLIDTINEDINDIQAQFNGLGLGVMHPQLTTAEITALANPANLNDINAYMPNGTVWFNTTLAKLQVQTAIVLGVGATIETITSV